MARGALWALAAALLAGAAAAQQAACPIAYSNVQAPLLFGGRINATCQRVADGKSCNQTPSPWWEVCKFNSWMTDAKDCTADQTAASIALADREAGGAPLRLSPCDMYPYLRGRTLWLIGDSHTKAMFRAMKCFLIDLWTDQKICEVSPDADVTNTLDHLPYKVGKSKCFHVSGGGRVCMIQAVKGWLLANEPGLPEGGVLQLLRKRVASPEDVFVVSFGAWHGPHGVEPQSKWTVDNYRTVLDNFGKFYQDTRASWPHLIWRETPTAHAKDLSSGLCQPFHNVTLGSLNAAAREVLGRYGVPMIGGTPQWTLNSTWGHPSTRAAEAGGQDCVHFCSPGVTELLLYEIARGMMSGVGGVRPLQAAEYPERKCKEINCKRLHPSEC